NFHLNGAVDEVRLWNDVRTADEIRDHCANLLAKFKIPRYIWLRTELLPRNASGKFLKRELRDALDPADAA
ncbi:MAG: hypothetical protein ACPGJJ_04885, partial [Parvibaculales bacterium]